MKTFDQILAIVRGTDGASIPVPTKQRTKVRARRRFTMEPTPDGVEHDLDVVVCTRRRWERISRGKRWRCDEFTTVSAGPVVVAIRVSR